MPELYVQGFSTGLPERLQVAMLRTLPGLERCVMMRPAYAVEYDFVPCQGQVTPTLMTSKVRGLFLAGQINGTTGYEEAAGQGLLAGINASLYVDVGENRISDGGEGEAVVGDDGEAVTAALVTRARRRDSLLVLPRSSSYLGVLIDDLCTKDLREPYRMLTSRREYRMSLRQDNAAARLSASSAKSRPAAAGRLARRRMASERGWRVGAACAIDGKLLMGSRGLIEAGHAIIDCSPGARMCGCGQRGCIEAYASANSVRRRSQEAVCQVIQSASHQEQGEEGQCYLVPRVYSLPPTRPRVRGFGARARALVDVDVHVHAHTNLHAQVLPLLCAGTFLERGSSESDGRQVAGEGGVGRLGPGVARGGA